MPAVGERHVCRAGMVPTGFLPANLLSLRPARWMVTMGCSGICSLNRKECRACGEKSNGPVAHEILLSATNRAPSFKRRCARLSSISCGYTMVYRAPAPAYRILDMWELLVHAGSLPRATIEACMARGHHGRNLRPQPSHFLRTSTRRQHLRTWRRHSTNSLEYEFD